MGGFGGVTWAAIIPTLLILAIAVTTLLPAAYLLDALALGEREAGHVGVDVERLKRRLVAQVALAVGAGTHRALSRSNSSTRRSPTAAAPCASTSG
jgi:iron complex transport system permease protein